MLTQNVNTKSIPSLPLLFSHIVNPVNICYSYRKAVEELLKEANRGKVRAETMGPAGW